MLTKLCAVVVLTVALATVGASNAEASFIMFIDNSDTPPPAGDGFATTVIGAGGVASFSCSTVASCAAAGLAGWKLTIDTGQSRPALAPDYPHMDLNFVATSTGSGVHVLNIWLADTGFNNAGPLFFTMGGTAGRNSTVQAFTYRSPVNNQWPSAPELASPIFVCGPFGSLVSTTPTSFTCDSSAPGIPTTFSITQRIRIVASGDSRVSSGDFELTSVPEPGSMILLGTGLIGLGTFVRQRRNRKV